MSSATTSQMAFQNQELEQIQAQIPCLTQVCRQVRDEFMPLYRASTRYCIQIEDVEQFLDTFILVDGLRGADLIGHVTIVSSSPPKRELNPRAGVVNLYPQVKLQHEANVNGWNFNALFTNNGDEIDTVSHLNPFLWGRNTLWANFVAQHVTGMEVYPAFGMMASI